MKHYLLILILHFSLTANAQIISGKIINSQSKKPLENALIFIENSTINTTSDKEGNFQINTKGLQQNLIIDYIGYKAILIKTSKLKERKIIIELEATSEELSELVITKSLFSRKDMLKCFKKYFLGETKNGKSCEIKNEDDLILYFNSETNTLHAESKEPLFIENKNLKYNIKFHLQFFEVHFNAPSLQFYNYQNSIFTGFAFFTDKSNNLQKTNSTRNAVYKNSIPFFLKTLASEPLKNKDYRLFLNGFLVPENEYFKTDSTENGYVINLIKTPTKKVPDINKLPKNGGKIILKAGEENNTLEVPTNLNILQNTTKNQSIVQLNANQIHIDGNGNLLNPGEIYFGGYFGSLKLGDMLPIDFKYYEK